MTIAIFLFGYKLGTGTLPASPDSTDDNCKELKDTVEKELISPPCSSECPVFPREPWNMVSYSGPSVWDQIFNTMYHTESPAIAEISLSWNSSWLSWDDCSNIFVIRTALKIDGAQHTCLALAQVPDRYTSFKMNMYRFGHTIYPQVLTNQYQNDIIQPHGYFQQKKLLPPLLANLAGIVKRFSNLLGGNLNSDGSRKTAIIMVANEGVMDLVINIICSAKSADISIENFVLFLAQPEYLPLVESMGIKAIHHPSFGDIPSSAAGNYADVTFGYLLWLKVIAAYVANSAGFDVLFADTDLVWIRDPLPFLHALCTSTSKSIPFPTENLEGYNGCEKYDMVFMDDGARSPRFTPFFFNSGFYFMRYNELTVYLYERLIRTIGEITYTHSHQTTLTRYAAETMYLFGLKVRILENYQFPSGKMYHRNKDYIEDIKAHRVTPYVFHMCWTANRNQKVK